MFVYKLSNKPRNLLPHFFYCSLPYSFRLFCSCPGHIISAIKERLKARQLRDLALLDRTIDHLLSGWKAVWQSYSLLSFH